MHMFENKSCVPLKKFYYLWIEKQIQILYTGVTSTHMKCVLFFFFVAMRPNAGHGLPILEVSRSHTTTHHSR